MGYNKSNVYIEIWPVSVKKNINFHINFTLCIFNHLIFIFLKHENIALWPISKMQVVFRKVFKKCRYSFKFINIFTYLEYKPVKPLRSQFWSTRACALFLKEPGFGWSRDFRCHHVCRQEQARFVCFRCIYLLHSKLMLPVLR